MQTCALGRSGLRVSRISFGSWLTLGCRVDYDETARLLHAAFDLGINLFDTADVYSDGDAEKAIGRALAYQPIPNAPGGVLFVQTDYGLPNDTEDRPSVWPTRIDENGAPQA
ncbi:MAG: aldo/keto reductase, partial [Deltaproteobacteria bacterium]|nr:aldo/keto reductase [Deltaproteobacteria bacterium]